MEEKVIVKEEKKIEKVVGTLISEDRVIAFSDAVFAFAATLLVLKITLPDYLFTHLDTNIPTAISILWPQYLANIISFLIIGYYWLTHHALFSMVKKFNAQLVWINLIFLIMISFIPFPVELFGDYPFLPIVAVFYCASLAVVGFVLAILWFYVAYYHRLIGKEFSKRHVHYYTARVLLAPVVFTVALPVVYVYPLIAQSLWIVVILGMMVINQFFHVRRLNETEAMSL